MTIVPNPQDSLIAAGLVLAIMALRWLRRSIR